jgi:uroporphyrinogen-III synthase
MTLAPLAGKRIVVTQAKHQAPELGALLTACGAIPLFYPCIAIEPPADTTDLDAALAAAAAGYYDWLVITSANTVLVLADRLQQMGLACDALAVVRVAAIGAPSAEMVARQFGRRADLIPEDSKAEGLAQVLKAVAERGQRMLVPQADIARPVLVQVLTEAGLDVTPVVAYRTTMGSGGVNLAALLAARQDRGDGSDGSGLVDAITFTSPSTVRNVFARLAKEGGDSSHLKGVVLACIGPITADALNAAGLPPAIVATNQSLEGLVEALNDYFRNPL